ncbi:MAG: ATP synthase subunit I [Nitrospirota bacterium]
MDDLIKRIYKQGILFLLVASVISAFFDWRRLPFSIFIGGMLGLVNLRGLAKNIRGLFGTHNPRGKLMFSSLIRLTMLGFVLALLFASQLVNVIGVLIGFTIIFIVILKEGLRTAKEYEKLERQK